MVNKRKGKRERDEGSLDKPYQEHYGGQLMSQLTSLKKNLVVKSLQSTTPPWSRYKTRSTLKGVLGPKNTVQLIGNEEGSGISIEGIWKVAQDRDDKRVTISLFHEENLYDRYTKEYVRLWETKDQDPFENYDQTRE